VSKWAVLPLLVVLVGAGLDLSFRPASGVVIDEKGLVSGSSNKIRYWMQGKDFLLSQKQLVLKKIKSLEEQPELDKKFNEDLRQMNIESAKMENDFYREHPDLKPSAAQLKADRLRELADAIEQKEFDDAMNKERLEEIEQLKRVVAYLANATGTTPNISWRDYAK